jgi:adenosine deaminase
VGDALRLTREEIAAIVRNGFNASLITAEAKAKALAEIDSALAESD